MRLSLAVIPLDSGGTGSVVIWSLVLIGLLLLAFGVYSYFKKWMTQADEPSRGAGFTLSDLRALRDQGKMTGEEYEMARAKMVAAAKRMTEKMPEVMPRKPKMPSDNPADIRTTKPPGLD
jgi:hypothetical protein